MRLKGKVALITGGDSRVGRRIASLFAQQGASVMLCGLNSAKGERAAAKLQAAGGRVRFMLADISLPTDVRDVVSETIATYGRLDILLNNGNGFTSRDAALSLLRENDWDRIVDLNLKGAFLCCQHTVPFLSRSGQGSIIHLPPAWWMTQPASPRLAEAVSRGGLLAMTRELADELASRNVRSNLIWPCILGAGQPPKTMHHQSLLASRVFQLSPQGPSKTRSIARIALYLASNDARNLNGAAIIVNLAR